jgi:streptomycin 6-kinase
MNEPNNLEHYLSAWNLGDPQLLTRTFTSSIYTVRQGGETVILKLFAATETTEQVGALALRYFDGQGAVRLLRYDAGAHLLEYAAGDELIRLVEQGQDEEATRIIAQVLKQLHGVPQDGSQEGLFGLEGWFGELFSKGKADRQAGSQSIYVRGAALAERLLVDRRELRVLHGDIHHRNIRMSGRGWLSFDPKGLVGERTYDCANTLCNPPMTEIVHNEARLLNNAAILAEALGIDMGRILAFTYAYACLNASWWVRLGSPEIVDWSLKVARIVEPHIK